MVITSFIYNWELYIYNDLPLIIGFGYDEKNYNKIAIVVNNFPLFKYSTSINSSFYSSVNTLSYDTFSKRLLRHYLEGQKTVYRLNFSNYKDYEKFYPTLFNVDIVSTFLTECNLETVGWISVDECKLNEENHFTTFENEYITSYKSIKPTTHKSLS